ncbi:MAG: glutaminyl-peptide cyclotransferase [Sphingomonas sp.]
MKFRYGIIVMLALIAAAAWLFWKPAADEPPPVYAVDVAAEYPHDPTAFTEGLFFRDGTLYEGTGEAGSSSVRQVDLKTGKVIRSRDLPFPYFGEGVISWNDRIYELTWKDQKGFIYNLKDFSPAGTFEYRGEGWGATSNGRAIIMSDGTPTLRYFDPGTFKQVSSLTVTAHGCPASNLNELEWIDGEIYANIWQTNLIARIDPRSGKVTSFLDVTGLGPVNPDRDDVPNGIAYDPAQKRMFMTGKRWPKLYQIRPSRREVMSDAASAISQCAPKR